MKQTLSGFLGIFFAIIILYQTPVKSLNVAAMERNKL